MWGDDKRYRLREIRLNITTFWDIHGRCIAHMEPVRAMEERTVYSVPYEGMSSNLKINTSGLRIVAVNALLLMKVTSTTEDAYCLSFTRVTFAFDPCSV